MALAVTWSGKQALMPDVTLGAASLAKLVPGSVGAFDGAPAVVTKR